MDVLTAAEMRQCDERTVERVGISWQSLMEAAGSRVAEFVAREFPAHKHILVLCGKGNNGGDGLVAARHLDAAGRNVRIVLLAKPEDLQVEARAEYQKLPRQLMRSLVTVTTDDDLSHAMFESCSKDADLLIDAILGTGFQPPLRGVAAAIGKKIAGHPAPVVSVDLPTGWDADSTAMTAPDAFRSDAVITFTAPKLAHAFGALTRGPVAVAQIGSPADVAISATGLHWTGASKTIIEQPRALDSNKGRFGHVLVVGGSSGKGGAPAMASLAAMRAGAGLTTAAVPRSVAAIVAGFAPEMMTLLLEESSSGGLSIGNLDPAQLEKMLRGMTTLAIGPGLGREPETAEFVRELVVHSDLPAVLDADGLNAFEGRTHLLDGSNRPLVLTPHPGEMARLLGCTIADVERDRLATARNFAMEHHVTLVLKGWRTLVAHPDGSIAVNTSGNPALAKGGSGDVLTGMVAALVAQFPKRIQQAVECAVWLHGAAADLFARKHDQHTMLATEILQHLSQAIESPVERDKFTWVQEGQR
ncbi:MAG TPA: NAD(P)H-hydrate dehydratase [Acidobacteriaceae bacterium]|nr:NAD(P)H-hydrate dehydratase [Acidobacteriaceae bacterium]